MNLLEHYIIEVIEVNVLNVPEYSADEYIEVKVLCDCWGDKRILKHLTTRKTWEHDLKRGYFMS